MKYSGDNLIFTPIRSRDVANREFTPSQYEMIARCKLRCGLVSWAITIELISRTFSRLLVMWLAFTITAAGGILICHYRNEFLF